jgi:tellurite resistance protein TerC
MKAFLFRNYHRVRMNTVPGVKKIIVAVIGGTVLLIGICLIVLPGPAFLVIPAGLAILATEFVWARHWLHKVRDFASRAAKSLSSRTAVDKAQEEAPPSASPKTK